MPRLLRRLLLWTVLCSVSATPSFVLASSSDDFSQAAMVVGVLLFIAAYTASTSTDAFERFHNRPFVRRTLYIGYGARMLVSVLFPYAWAADMIPGIISVGLVQNTLGLEGRSF